jgi:hypothetical protein
MITVRKITDFALMQEIIEFCTDVKESKYSEFEAYRNEHSLIRVQFFLIKMTIPTFVSVHLVRHSQTGQFHFAYSNREDRGGKDKKVDRNTPINHCMVLNAKHLIDMSRYRLCTKASVETHTVWSDIKIEVEKVDKELSKRMVPNCWYRGGVCPEPKSCGVNKLYTEPTK